MEVQLTDFENAAFAVFIVLLSRAIMSQNLNFYIPISKVRPKICSLNEPWKLMFLFAVFALLWSLLGGREHAQGADPRRRTLVQVLLPKVYLPPCVFQSIHCFVLRQCDPHRRC